MKRFNLHFAFSAWCAAGVLTMSPAWADQPALIEGGGIAITADDMRADAQRMPPEMQSLVLSKPQTVLQIASNLYARRALAQQAEMQGLEKTPAVQAMLKVARDKVLSDAMLEHIDKRSAPAESALEGMARNTYRANPDRFKTAEEIRIRHILISGADAAARAKAEALLKQIKQGADFEALAKANSADAGSASQGGDLGFVAKGRMVPEFELAAFELEKPGSVSDVVQTKFGFHILKLDERRAPRVRAFDEVRVELIKEVKANALQEARAAEAQKFQQTAKPNEAAIEAFSANYKPAAK